MPQCQRSQERRQRSVSTPYDARAAGPPRQPNVHGYCVFALIALLSLLSACHPEGGAPDSGSRAQQIINGDIDSDDAYPWVVKLRAPGGVCTGVLVDERYALTAAHCVCPGQATDDGGERREAGHCASTAYVSTWQGGTIGSTQEAAIFVHPDFLTVVDSEGTVDVARADIAVVELSGCGLDDVPVASLPVGDEPQVGAEVNIAGYGPLVCGGQSRSERFLGRARIEAVDDGFVDVRPISTIGQSAASGDSGGPVFDDDGTVFGVVSYGSCGSTVSYIDVRSELSWVTGVLNRGARCDAGVASAPPESWTCGGLDFADGVFCDCGCGEVDPDCDAGLPVRGCTAGQTCAASGECVVSPADGWFCPADSEGDGAACDCNCGAADSDCGPGNVQAACSAGLSCAEDGVCRTSAGDVPGAWTCDDDLYADGAFCDCGCGFPDPDCMDPETDSRTCQAASACSAEGDRCVIDPRACGGVAALTHKQTQVTLNTCNHEATFGCNVASSGSRDLVVSLEGFENEPLRIVASSDDMAPFLYPVSVPCDGASTICAAASSGGSEATLDFAEGNLKHVVVDASGGCGVVDLELVFPDHPGEPHPFPCDASTEVCDGRDNDCDGLTDEETDGALCEEADGLVLLGCGGTGGCIYACPEGQAALAGDPMLGCVDELPVGNGEDEICDGIDNNQNDQIDETGVFGCDERPNAVAVSCDGAEGCGYRCVRGFRDADKDDANGCETEGSSNKGGCSSHQTPPGAQLPWLAVVLLVAMQRWYSRTAAGSSPS